MFFLVFVSLFADASYFKVRTDGRYINKALLVVTGIREDGYRGDLSAKVADSEDESCWESCFEDLKARGLSDVKLVISDGHKGIQSMCLFDNVPLYSGCPSLSVLNDCVLNLFKKPQKSPFGNSTIVPPSCQIAFSAS